MAGNVNKHRNELAHAIQGAAMRGFLDRDGGIIGTRKMNGYVCSYPGHDDEGNEVPGTVDVQEYGFYYDEGDKNVVGEGWHGAVRLAACDDNQNGMLIVPQMYSEVIFEQDPITGDEWVSFFSHVQLYQIKSTEEIHIEAQEYEDFNESDDGLEKDYYELEKKKRVVSTHYDLDGIEDNVKNDGSSTNIKKTPGDIMVTADDSTLHMDGDLVHINGTEQQGVRGNDLVDLLNKLFTLIQNGKVISKGSPLSTAPEIGRLKMEVDKILSKKVRLT